MLIKQIAPNQIKITTENKLIFQSYDSNVLIYDTEVDQITLGKDWDYSKTTLKHLYSFGSYQLPTKHGTNDFICICQSEIKNKRQAIQELINNNIIKYDESL